MPRDFLNFCLLHSYRAAIQPFPLQIPIQENWNYGLKLPFPYGIIH